MFLLPDFPGSKTGGGKWLFTEEEQKLAVDRIHRDRVSIAEADESIMHGLKLAVTDYRTWVFVSYIPADQRPHYILTYHSLLCFVPIIPRTDSTTSTLLS